MDGLEATITYIRCEQLLAEARARLATQRRLALELAELAEAQELLRTMQESTNLLNRRRTYLRERMRWLNGVSESGPDLV